MANYTSASQHWIDSPCNRSERRKPRPRFSSQLRPSLVFFYFGLHYKLSHIVVGLGNNPKSQERAFELGSNLASLLGCQVRFFHTWYMQIFKMLYNPITLFILLWCQGGNGTLLSCIQAIEDGFDILDATDYGPYPNIDKVTSSFFTKRNHVCMEWTGPWRGCLPTTATSRSPRNWAGVPIWPSQEELS